jgi:hypothetical protein
MSISKSKRGLAKGLRCHLLLPPTPSLPSLMCNNTGMQSLIPDATLAPNVPNQAAGHSSKPEFDAANGGRKVALVLGLMLTLGACTTVKKDDHSYTYVYQHNVTPPKQVVETVTTRETRRRRYTSQDDLPDQPNEPEIPWQENSAGEYSQDDDATPSRARRLSNDVPSNVPTYFPSYAPTYVQPSYDPPVITPYYRTNPVSTVAAASFYSPPPSVNLNFRSDYNAFRSDSSYQRTRSYSQPTRTPCGVVSGSYSPPTGGRIASRNESSGACYSFSGRAAFGNKN